ncbi:hypothetical protein A9174_19760 [Mesorhizobium loti NZP2037]|nr:hypothetical protein A9174_19760 [Mesorhizobium loti NZP2037]
MVILVGFRKIVTASHVAAPCAGLMLELELEQRYIAAVARIAFSCQTFVSSARLSGMVQRSKSFCLLAPR